MPALMHPKNVSLSGVATPTKSERVIVYVPAAARTPELDAIVADVANLRAELQGVRAQLTIDLAEVDKLRADLAAATGSPLHQRGPAEPDDRGVPGPCAGYGVAMYHYFGALRYRILRRPRSSTQPT